jgi:hypothetical protein
MFLNIGYSNEWWYANHGFSFEEELYQDPLRKLAVQHHMDGLLREKFAKWDFLGHLEDTSVLSRPSVDIEPFGHRFIPAMFDVPVCYAKDQAPWASTIRLDDDFIMSLEPLAPEAFANDPRVGEIVRQHTLLKTKGHTCSTQQNLGSVMNSAIYMRGMDLFYDFNDRPELVHKLFDLITQVMLLSYDYFSEIDGYRAPLGVGNCSVAMLSPKIYREFCYPYDLRIMEHAKKCNVSFAVHQDSCIDAFIPVYKNAFDSLLSFDIGGDSNVRLFREAFPNLMINVFIYTSVLRTLTAGQLYDLILRLAEEGQPYSQIGFSVYDIDPQVGDEKIESICDAYALLKAKE